MQGDAWRAVRGPQGHPPNSRSDALAGVGSGGAEAGGWLDAPGGSAVNFADGDSVVFGDAENDVVITAKGSFSVGDFLVNASNKYTIKGTKRNEVDGVLICDGVITDAASVIKRGSGTLKFELFSGNWKCPMNIENGRFEGTYQVNYMDGVRNWANPTNSFFGDLSVERDITVGTPETPAVVEIRGDSKGNYPDFKTAGNPLYQMNNFALVTPNVVPKARFVFDNGLFHTNSARTVFGPVVLRNGASIAKAKYDGSLRYYNGDIKVERRADNLPSPRATMVEPDTDGGNFFSTSSDGLIAFDVDEVTATADDDGNVQDDGETDLYVALRIHDSNDDRWPGRTGWIKRGKGKMELHSCAGKCVAVASEYTGDIIVEEGTLWNSTSANGNYKNRSLFGRADVPDRKIVVNPGATLSLCGASLQANGVAMSPVYTLFATNATIVSRGSNLLPNMELCGSTRFITTGVDVEVGIITFGDRTYFNLDYPFVLTNLLTATGGARPGNSNFICIGYGTDRHYEVTTNVESGVTTYMTNVFGFAELCIEEAKNKTMGIADVIIDTSIRNIHPQTQSSATERRHCGILKTGPGVLSITKSNSNKSYPGNTGSSVIREGGLLLGGAGEIRTNVFVNAGACIGGTGKVLGSLYVEEGGGFLVDADNLSNQLTVNCNLEMPRDGLLTVYNYNHDITEVAMYLNSIPLPKALGDITLAGSPAGKNGDNTAILGNYNVENWQVVLKGFDKKECKKHLKVMKNPDDTLSVTYEAKSGFNIIVR